MRNLSLEDDEDEDECAEADRIAEDGQDGQAMDDGQESIMEGLRD